MWLRLLEAERGGRGLAAGGAGPWACLGLELARRHVTAVDAQLAAARRGLAAAGAV